MMNSKKHKVYGVVFESELELNGADESKEATDVIISFGKTPERLEVPVIESILYQASKNEFLLEVLGVARYYVKDGNQILIERFNNTDDRDILAFLYNSVFAALLQQRGLLVFRGMVAKINNELVPVLGESYSGKSFLAALMYEKGHDIFSDELCVLKVSADGTISTVKGLNRIHLWKDTMKKLGKYIENFTPVRDNLRKYIFNTSVKSYKKNEIIRSINILEVNNDKEASNNKILGHRKLNELRKKIHNIELQELYTGKIEFFRMLTSICEKNLINSISYCNRKINISEVAEMIENREKSI